MSRRRSSRSGAADAPTAGKAVYADWVWWPNEDGRRSRAQEEFRKLPRDVQGSLLDLMKRFLEGESRYKDVKDLGHGIKEIRHRSGNNHHRVLFFIDGSVCVVLTCFYKNKNKVEKHDLDRAKQRKADYRKT